MPDQPRIAPIDQPRSRKARHQRTPAAAATTFNAFTAFATLTALTTLAATTLPNQAQAQPADPPADLPADLPVLTVTHDDFPVNRSCILRFAGPIPDANGDGVVHITGPDLTVVFDDAQALQSTDEIADTHTGTPWDQLTGIGLRIQNAPNLTLRHARVHGYKVAIHATRAPGLTVEDAELSDNYRARLASTKLAEDGGGWLSPHHNDDNQWADNYGAALYIEDSDRVTVRRVHVRRGQNGIVLDRVNDSAVYDNDVSFLSGWGIALWRSSGNVISRNAADFCVRGHSEGVYNRGQDSAGILFFEQCSDNLIIQNSATHGGDGFFGFAGLEALGTEQTRNPDLDYHKVGCNNNIFLYNDLSYAPAHGLEMTFSFGNVIKRNRFVQNAICGVWGGFSQDTLINENYFEGNGGMAYGLERGGVNIEHSINNTIVNNTFVNNRTGVALWWDNPGAVNSWAWGVNYGDTQLEGNAIAYNTFVINDQPQPFHRLAPDEKRIGIWLRDDAKQGHLSGTTITGNDMRTAGRSPQPELIDEGIDVNRANTKTMDIDADTVMAKALGQTRPVVIRDSVPYSVREALRGRENILVDQWGPWDHERPFIRVVKKAADEQIFEVFGLAGPLELNLTDSGDVQATAAPTTDMHGGPSGQRVRIHGEPGVQPFNLTLRGNTADGQPWEHTLNGTLIQTRWQVAFFPWTDANDPREDLQGWQRLAQGKDAVTATLPGLAFPYGFGGPSDQAVPDNVKRARLAPDRFGMIARSRMPLAAGTWRITTVSDDGVRVLVDGEPIIDNWTWHPPQTDTATFTLDRDRDVRIEVMHFEIDGGATLEFDITKVK